MPLNINPSAGERQLVRVPRPGQRGDVEVRHLQAVRPGAPHGRRPHQDADHRVGGLRLQPVVPPVLHGARRRRRLLLLQARQTQVPAHGGLMNTDQD